MKKTLRILILVLSLALVFGMIAVVANAEEESKGIELTQSAIDDDEDGIINFTSNMYVTATINIAKNVTLNLNGYTLTVDKAAFFNYTEVSTLTVNGPGHIDCALFAKNTNDSKAGNLVLKGVKNQGLSINQQGDNVQFVINYEGTVTIDNVRYFSDSPWTGNSDVCVFDTENKAGVSYVFSDSSFTCNTASNFSGANPIPVVDDNGVANNSSIKKMTANSFVQIGSTGNMDMDNCNVKFQGQIFHLGQTGKNRTDTVVTVDNSVLDAYTEAAGERTLIFYGGQSYNVSGYVRVKDSAIGSTYGIAFNGWDGSAIVNDPFNILIEDSTISNYGANHGLAIAAVKDGAASKYSADETNSPLSGNADVYLKNCVYLTKSPSLVNRKGNAFVTVGTRSNLKISSDKNNNLYYPADITIDQMIADTDRAKTISTFSGDGSTTQYVSTDTGIKWVYDPVGNPSAPWLAVPADSTEASTYISGDTNSYQNYENTKFILTNEAYAVNRNDFYVSNYNDDGTLGSAVSTLAGTNVSGTNGASTGLPGNWHIAGNMSLVKTPENNYIKWYVPANPKNPEQTMTTIKGDGSSPNLFLSTDGYTAVSSNDQYKVAVYELSLATETQYPNGSLYVQVRTSAQVEYARLKIADNKIAVERGFKLEQDVTDADLDISNGWHHLTFIVYFDLNTQANNVGSGMQFVYLDGKHIATADMVSSNKTDAYSTYGLRYDILKDQVTGASFLYDNMSTRLFKNLQDGESFATADSKGVYKPELYAASGADKIVNFVNPSAPVAAVGGAEYYYDVTTALEAAEDSDFDAVLLSDAEELITYEKVGVLYTNGYTFTPKAGSVSYFKDYATNNDFSVYAPDEIDDGAITFDASRKAAYAFTIDEENFFIEYFSIGEIPDYDYSASLKLTKKGQTLYQSGMDGWMDYYSDEALVPITEKDYELYFDGLELGYEGDDLIAEGHVSYAVPHLAEETEIDSAITVVLVDKDGYIKWTSKNTALWAGSSTSTDSVWGMNPQYGDTLIINKNVQFCGSLKVNPQLSKYESISDIPREQRVFSVDLNGHEVRYDPTGGNNDTSSFIIVREGETFNLYSSVEGAAIKMYGWSGANVNSSYVVQTQTLPGSPVDTATAGTPDFKELYESLQAGNVYGFDTVVNIGTAKDYTGAEHDGSNMTIYCDGLYQAGYSDVTAVTNIDGIKIYKTAHAQAILNFVGYNGTVNITDFDIIGGATNQDEDDKFINGNVDAKYFKANEYRAKATVNVNNGTFFTGHVGQWLVLDEGVFEKIHFENFTSNADILGTRADIDAVWVGENVTARCRTSMNEPSHPQYHVSFDEGVRVVRTYVETPDITSQYLTGELTSTNDEGNKFYAFTKHDYAITGDVRTETTAKEENIIKVTVNGIGADNTVEYVKGATVRDSDFASQLAAVNGTAITTSFAGTFNGGEITLPKTFETDTTLVADVTTAANVSGLLQNLTLYSGFEINVYVPAAYASVLTGVTVDGETIDLANAKVVIIEDKEYIMLVAERNATETTKNAEIVLNFKEGDFTFEKTASVSILDYAKYIINGEYTDAEKNLMKYIIAYAKAANAQFNVTDEAVENTEIGELEGYEKNYVAIDEEASNAIATVFKSVTIDLSGAAPKYVFKVADGFNGTVTLNGKVCDVKAGETIEIDDLRAYNFLAGVTIVAEGVNATVTFANYAASPEAEAVSDIVDAIYDYCKAAEEFIAAK